MNKKKLYLGLETQMRLKPRCHPCGGSGGRHFGDRMMLWQWWT